MKSEELTKELERYQQKMSALISRMDNLYREIQDGMPAAAAFWMNKEVETRIKDDPDAAQALGIDKLRELKAKLKALTEKLPEIVAAELQDRSRWPHHIERKEIGSPNRQRVVYLEVCKFLGKGKRRVYSPLKNETRSVTLKKGGYTHGEGT
jgi:hypothetical protein